MLLPALVLLAPPLCSVLFLLLAGSLVRDASGSPVMLPRLQDANPLAHVLQAIDEPLELVKYDTWNVIVPEGEFLTRVREKE